jgi:hypothetical protein
MLRREGRTQTVSSPGSRLSWLWSPPSSRRLEVSIERTSIQLGSHLQEARLCLRLTLNKVVTGGAVPPGLERRATFGVSRHLAWDRVPCAPMCQQTKGPGQFLALGGQLVRGAGWSLGVQPGHHQHVALEPLEPFGQNVRCEPWDVILKVVESPRPSEQGLNDEQRPAITDPSESLSEW